PVDGSESEDVASPGDVTVDRALAGEEDVGQRLVDDRDLTRPLTVGGGELPAPEERDAGSAEVVGVHRAAFRARNRLAWRQRLPLDLELQVEEGGCERHVGADAHVHYAGKRPD